MKIHNSIIYKMRTQNKKFISSHTSKTLLLELTNKTYCKLQLNCYATQKMIQYDDSFEDDSILPFVINPQSNPTRGQVKLFYNLFVNFFENGNGPFEREFLEVNFKRRKLHHYLSDIEKITSHYSIFRSLKL